MVEEFKLTGKVALITGSTRGLGRIYAHKLAQAGADIILHDINANAASKFGEASSGEAVVQEIREIGREAAFLTADLADPDQIQQFVNKAIEHFGKIDILVNNAGGDIGAKKPRPEPNDAIDIEVEDIQSVIDRNLLNVMCMCKYVGEHMRENKSGKIINIGSGAGHVTTTEGIIYASVKTAISHYTLCLGEQLRSNNVNVNCLAPAATYTGRFKATREIENQDGLSRLQQVAQPDDMAKIVLFLSSTQSDYLTSETIVCR